MPNLEELQSDLQTLHEAIDQEAPLQEIRIAALRALTRHRFFTEEMLKATGDWEPRKQKEEWERKADVARREHVQELIAIANSRDRSALHAFFTRYGAPPLPEEVSKRASQPLGQFLKYIVHRLASVCLRDREEEAGEHYQRETRSFETELEGKENAQEFLEKMPPERREEFMEKAMEFMKEREERAEPGDDWVDMDELVGSDEAFEANRRHILCEDGQELQLYLMLLERRLKIGEAYSGLELINDQEIIPWPQEKPDWEPDEERDELIAKLEAVTGQSFRSKS